MDVDFICNNIIMDSSYNIFYGAQYDSYWYMYALKSGQTTPSWLFSSQTSSGAAYSVTFGKDENSLFVGGYMDYYMALVHIVSDFTAATMGTMDWVYVVIDDDYLNYIK
jgi:hypothetical protein